MQHEVGYVYSQSDKPVIATFGAGPCIAIAAYNQSTKEAMLAHVDSFTTLPSVIKSLEKVIGDADIEVHLAGGNHGSQHQVADLIKAIEDHPQMEIKSCDVLGNIESRSLVIDARDGTVYNQVNARKLDLGSDANLRLQLVSMQFSSSPLKESFDDRVLSKKKEIKRTASNSKIIESTPKKTSVKNGRL